MTNTVISSTSTTPSSKHIGRMVRSTSSLKGYAISAMGSVVTSRTKSPRCSRSAAEKLINTEKTISNLSILSKISPAIPKNYMDIKSDRQWLDTFFIG